jgi:hypothetical protein
VSGGIIGKGVVQKRLGRGGPGLMDLEWFDRPRWREGEPRSRVQRFRHRSRSQTDDRSLVELQEAQVRIRAADLHSEQLLDILRLGDREAAVAGTELHESQLVILAALELECATIGAVGQD